MLRILDVAEAHKTILRRKRFASDYPIDLLEDLEQRFGQGTTPEQAVEIILASIRAEGDPAIRRWTEEFDGISLQNFRVPEELIRDAEQALPEDLRRALMFAIEKVRAFHSQQPIPGWSTKTPDGEFGQTLTPVASAGVYVPGGTAPLISSLYMSVIPAQVAGVQKIVVCTPPEVEPALLAVASMLGIDEIYSVGGAQAIGAMAYGTQSIPAVDMIVGAGNLFVTLAKKEVYGTVGIDGLAGPTETMILADEQANPEWIAADLLAQAEHDPLASAILITDSRSLAATVQREVKRQIQSLPRREIIERSLNGQGGIVLVSDMWEAVDLANDYAPEHLCLAVKEEDELFSRVRNAGCVFLGESSFEVLGDYVAGPSHVLPTGGSARFASPLNVLSFLNMTSHVQVNRQSGSNLSWYAYEVAMREKLSAHAESAKLRVQGGNDEG